MHFVKQNICCAKKKSDQYIYYSDENALSALSGILSVRTVSD